MLTGCTSSYRVRLPDPTALAALQAADVTVPGLDLADRPADVRARAILALAPGEEAGLRHATVRDGRPVRHLGATLLLLGLGAGLSVAAAGAGAADPALGLAIGGGVAALGAAVGLPCLVAGAAADSPIVDSGP